MGTRDGQALLPTGDFTQRAGALDDLVSLFPYIYELLEAFRDGRGIYYQGLLHVLRDEVDVVLEMDPDSFLLQSGGEFGRRAVIS